MHILMLSTLIFFGACGYLLSPPLLIVFSIPIYLMTSRGHTRDSSTSGIGNALAATFNIFLIINLVVMWLIALAVRWEVISQFCLNYWGYIFR